jgi:hypothetical protein
MILPSARGSGGEIDPLTGELSIELLNVMNYNVEALLQKES